MRLHSRNEVLAAVAPILIVAAITGCSANRESSELQVPAVASPSPADKAYEEAGMTRACHLAATDQIYGRNLKRADDGAGRVYQIAAKEEAASGEEIVPSLFFDAEASSHPVSWLSEIACAPEADRIAVAYDVSGSAGEPAGEPWLVVLDGEGRIVTEWTLSEEAGPVQISFAPAGDRLGWVGLDGIPRLASWTSGEEPLTIDDLALRSVSGAPGGDIVWGEDGRFVAYSAWSGIGPGGATIALASAEDGRALWQRKLDGDVLAWFDDGHLVWATAPWDFEAGIESATQPTTLELWRMDEPAAEAGSEAASTQVDVLEFEDADAVARWIVERR